MEEIIHKGITFITTTYAGLLIKETVKEYVSPRLKILSDNSLLDKDREKVEENILDYLERSYKNNEYINTIVFKNQQKKLEDLYIPLKVIKHMGKNNKKDFELCIDKYDENFIPLHNKVLLVDNAGMGKSTIMKFLYLNVIKENKGIPILIELRKLEKNISIIDFIIKEINRIDSECNKKVISELIRGGDFIFFFDGYDEITLENKESITRNIQEFIDKAHNNKFIISSRDEDELNSFGDFQRFYIKSLIKEEAYELIKRYDENGDLSKELIDKLENEENLKILKEFLENPLRVSLLYKAFEYNKSIPYKKHIFYKQVYDALFEQYDLSKGGAYKHIKKSGLDIDDFHKILRCVGFITLSKGISYTREDLIEIINTAKEKNSEIDFKVTDFIWDIVHSVPIFVRDGLEYKWVHKSFQEYFAASYICNDSKSQEEKLLKAITNENKIFKYYNILDFCYDMDYKNFSRSILEPITLDFIKYSSKNYVDEYFYRFYKEDLQMRKSLEFSYEKILIKKLDEEPSNKPILSQKFKEIFNEIEFDGTIKMIINHDIAITLGSKRKTLLLKLLYNKGNSIVKYMGKSNFGFSFLEELVKLLKENKWSLVNDDIRNNINKEENFIKFNEWIQKEIASSSEKLGLVFDYDECVKLKKIIDKEIDEEKNDIDFL
ncbi:MAG: NACHT domain-containing protein [Clostridium perfringens]